MPSGIDFYSQSRDRYDVEAKKRGNLMDLLSIISLGSAAAGGAAAKEGVKAAAKTSLKSAGTSQIASQTAQFGSKVSLGGSTSNLVSSGGKLVAESAGKEGIKHAAMAQMAKYLGAGKQEGLSTLVNNILPPSGSGVVNPEVHPLAKSPQEAFSEWTAQQNQPQSKGSFLGGLKKGALGMPQEAGETSPWFYAGALIPSVIRSKLGVDTTFEAAYRKKSDISRLKDYMILKGLLEKNKPTAIELKKLAQSEAMKQMGGSMMMGIQIAGDKKKKAEYDTLVDSMYKGYTKEFGVKGSIGEEEITMDTDWENTNF